MSGVTERGCRESRSLAEAGVGVEVVRVAWLFVRSGVGGRLRGMATPQELIERAVPLLPAGSTVRHAFICQSASHFAIFWINWLTGLTMFLIRYRCVVVTDEAIYVLAGPALWGGAKPTAITATIPRATRLGPVTGRWGEIRLADERYWVKRRFQPQIAAADRDAGLA